MRLMKLVKRVFAILKRRIEWRRIRSLASDYWPYYLDNLSKGLIEARLNVLKKGSFAELLASYIKLGYDKWDIPELGKYDENKVFYLLGEGDRYEYCVLLLKHSEYCNRTKIIGTDLSIWENAPYDSVLIAIKENNIMQRQSTDELKSRYPDRLIHETSYGAMLVGTSGWQYFDVFAPKKEEVFVNAGAFQGETDITFAKWTNNTYKKIYAFEPIKDDVDICQKSYEENNIQRVELFCKGTWSETGVLSFSEGANMQGRIDESGNAKIEVIRIDDAVGGGEVTFIKMDIEGAELKALQGARETIIRNKPRMAICIYHKPVDLYEIPQYLLSLVPEYRFKVRQYTSMNWETVLYAAIDSDW